MIILGVLRTRERIYHCHETEIRWAGNINRGLISSAPKNFSPYRQVHDCPWDHLPSRNSAHEIPLR